MTEKPAPPIDAWSEPYWAAAQAGKLLIQHCQSCGRHVFYPRLACPHCWSEALEWVEASGRGTVHAYSVVRNNAPSAFMAEMPFVIAIVRLEEGVQMMSNIVGCDPETVYSGMPVQVTFEALTDELMLPKFKPRVPAG